MEFHLPGNPGAIKVGIPPAFFLILRVFVLVSRADEWNAEEALLAVHFDLLLPGRKLNGRVLLSYLLHRTRRVTPAAQGITKQPLILKGTTNFFLK